MDHRQTSQLPRGNTVIAHQSYSGELARRVSAKVAPGAGLAVLVFRDAKVSVWSGVLNWEPRTDWHIMVRYQPSRTDFEARPGKVWNHSAPVRAVWDARRRFSPYLMAAIGNESFAALSADRLGRLTAQIYGGGFEFPLMQAQGIHFGYHRENRSHGRRVQMFEVSH